MAWITKLAACCVGTFSIAHIPEVSASTFTFDNGVYTNVALPTGLVVSASGMNDAGYVVGTYQAFSGIVSPFLYVGTSLTLLNIPGSNIAYGKAINNVGQIIGAYDHNRLHGFLYDNNTITTIDVAPNLTTTVNDINDAGQIVGSYYEGPFSYNDHGFVYSGGAYTSFDVPASVWTRATGINNRGQIVGYYVSQSRESLGFLYTADGFTSIKFPGSYETVATDINDAGQIIGNYAYAGTYHGFLLSGGIFTSIDPPNTSLTRLQAINNHGVILGVSDGSFGPVPDLGTFALLVSGLPLLFGVRRLRH